MASTVWRGHLTFGLLSIPVRLFRAARAGRVPLRRVARSSSLREVKTQAEDDLAAPATSQATRESSPLAALRQGSYSADTGVAVRESSITKAVEVQPNRFVEIPPDDLKKLKAATSPDIAIQEFVSLQEIDPLYFETSYYVVPEEVGERAYALLYQTLITTHVVALAEISMHGRDHVLVIRPGHTGLVAHTMFYTSEVHLDEQFQAATANLAGKELELAQALVKSLTTSFEPEKYKNVYRTKLQELIEDRVSGSPQALTPAAPKAGTEIVDIADALRRSLAQLKKPVQSTAKAKKAAKAHAS